MDEVSFGKHHKYLTVVIDFKTDRIIWFSKGRKADTVNNFFEKIPQKKITQIQVV